MKRILGVTLGVLTAVGGFVDIGDLVASSAAGARFGMHLAWVVVAGGIGIIVFADMAGRVAAISKRPVFDLVRERCGPSVGMANLAASTFVNLLTLIAEIGGIALALQLATSVNYLLWIPLCAFLVWIVVWRVKFGSMETIFGLLGLALIVAAVALWQLHPSWSDLWHQTRSPAKPHSESWPSYWYWAISLFASAMTPYEVFFFSSGGVEEKWTAQQLNEERANVFVGFPLGVVLALALMGLTAVVFRPHGIQVDHLSQVSQPISLALGKLGLAFALIGFFACTFGAALEAGLSSGYAFAQYFGWPWGKEVAPRKAARFHLVVLVGLVVAVVVGLTSVDPVKVTEYSLAFSAVALPLTYFPILLVANDPAYMGDKVNGKVRNALGLIFMVIVAVAAVGAIPLMIWTKGGA